MQGVPPAARAPNPTPEPPLAPLLPRVACLVYEALLLAALLLCAGVAFYGLEHTLGAQHVRWGFQMYLVAVVGLYFVWQWVHGGQTLAMKTWGLRVIMASGGSLSASRAAARCALGFFGAALGGVGFLWAFIDRDRQFLHDRLAGTRIIRDRPSRLR